MHLHLCVTNLIKIQEEAKRSGVKKMTKGKKKVKKVPRLLECEHDGAIMNNEAHNSSISERVSAGD